MIAAMMMAAALQTAAPMNSSDDLTVMVQGVRDNVGKVHVDVCTSDEFLGKNCFASASAPATKGVTKIVVRGVGPGVYAVQAWQDRNGNGRVDRGALGVPTEDVGFSGSTPALRRPEFSLASFSRAAAAPQAVTVRLKHYF